MSVLEYLKTPLDPNRVSKRAGGGGMQLSYLEGWDVIQKANEIFGYGNWGYTVLELVHIGTEPVTTANGREGFRTAYRALVEVEVKVVTARTRFSDVGYGDAVDYSGSTLTSHELASKEAVTDALKRALKNLGDQFGLCLYDKTAPEHQGLARDPLAPLKNLVIEKAMEAGVEMTPEAIAAYFKVEVADLQDEEMLLTILGTT